MKLTDVYSAKRVALVYNEVASNKIAYLGEGLFPTRKKMGLDLSWIKTSKGLPVSLKPSAFDTVSTLRSREGISLTETQMAFFKESMLVKEKDEQDIMRVLDSSDPYAKEVISRVFDDATTLVDGANVVPERMIFQLLAPQTNGKPQISISADNAVYAYDYDPDGSWTASNYKALTGTSAWSDLDDSDPIKDVSDACDAVEAATGSRPTKAILSAATMALLKSNEKVRSYILAQNATANIVMTDARVKELFANELGVALIVYTKQYKDESGNVAKFMPDKFFTLIPDGALGNTWKGTTPEERTLLGNPTADVAITANGVAIAVTVSNDPVQTKTTVSEIVLPSYERMNEVYVLKVTA